MSASSRATSAPVREHRPTYEAGRTDCERSFATTVSSFRSPLVLSFLLHVRSRFIVRLSIERQQSLGAANYTPYSICRVYPPRRLLTHRAVSLPGKDWLKTRETESCEQIWEMGQTQVDRGGVRAAEVSYDAV